MSHRAFIAIHDNVTGAFIGIYLHNGAHDGQRIHDTLSRYYRTPAKRRALTALGALSTLGERCTKPAGHSFDTPVKGYCVAYARDRGDRETFPTVCRNFGELVQAARDHDAEWLHVYTVGEWDSVPVA